MKTKTICFVLSVLALTAAAQKADACTNVIVTKGASADGSNMVTYAADSHWLYGELYFHPAMDWAAGSMLRINEWDSGRYLGDIPQVAHTYKTVGNMNEHQLIIGETTWGGRMELMDKNGKIDYGSLIYVALQRAKTAREAIKVIVDLANEHGYFSEGETFSIADKEEAWIMDLVGKGTSGSDGSGKGIVWVARRIPDGYICAHANQARIGTFPKNDPENCLYAPDVISFAKAKGYFQGADEDFSFCDAYCPLDFGGLRGCEARVWSAFNILGKGKITFSPEYAYGAKAGRSAEVDVDNGTGAEVDAENGVDGKAVVMVTKDASDYLDYAMGYNKNNRMPLFIKPDKKVSVKELADVMRDHYEGTPMDMTTDIGAGGNALPYRWRPMGFEVNGKNYVNERAIATQQTGFWFLAQARNLPDIIGGLLWFGTDDAATSYLTPIYTNINEVPECVREGNGDLLTYSPTSSFWINSRVTNACYKMYNYMAPYVRERADKFENEQMGSAVSKTDAEALGMYNEIIAKYGDKSSQKAVGKSSKKLEKELAKVKDYLTDYTIKTAQHQFQSWVELEQTLLVKFIDGNVKAQNEDGSFKHTEFSEHVPDGLTQPGYTQKWKEAVAADHGDVVEVKELK